MSIPAITIEVLPAAYGDCLLIQCPVGKRTWRMLVDTGPDETYPALKARLAGLLGTSRSPLPWNVAFGGKAAVTPGDGGFLELRPARGAPRITLLSPSPDRLNDLFKV